MQLASARARENFHCKVLMPKVGTSVSVDRKLRPRKRRVNYMEKLQVMATDGKTMVFGVVVLSEKF